MALVTRKMSKVIKQTVSLLVGTLMAWAQPAFCSPVAFTIQPAPPQTATMDHGTQIVWSDLATSTVLMSTPQPTEDNRVKITFLFVNKGLSPVNIGPENVSGSPISLVTYDQLMAEQRADEKRDAFIAALGALGNSLHASATGGRQYGTQSYSGYVDCGIGCNAAYRGSGSTQSYNPYLAQQAQRQATAQNQAAFAELRNEGALNRASISANLRTTTVLPNQSLGGMLTFSIPRTIRRSKTASPFILKIRIGQDVHVLSGYAGPIGAAPPTSAPTDSVSNSSLPAQTGMSSATLTATRPVITIEAFRRGEPRS